jgi:hypothetical protein
MAKEHNEEVSETSRIQSSPEENRSQIKCVDGACWCNPRRVISQSKSCCEEKKPTSQESQG